MQDSYAIAGKWLGSFDKEFSGSDRACAIVVGAVLDDRLKTLLLQYLLPPKSTREDRLLGRAGSLESFSSRIELSQRLGLVGLETGSALDWVREIRNEAAHREDFDFSHNKVRSRVANIVNVLEMPRRMPTLLVRSSDTPKGHFVSAAVILVFALELEISATKRAVHFAQDVLKPSVNWSVSLAEPT